MTYSPLHSCPVIGFVRSHFWIISKAELKLPVFENWSGFSARIDHCSEYNVQSLPSAHTSLSAKKTGEILQ